MSSYPWEETGGQTPLRPEVLAKLAGKFNFGAWNGSGALYGTKAQVAEARRLVKKALSGKVRQLQFLDERMLNFATRFAPVARLFTTWDLSRALDLLRPLFGLIQGVPTSQPMDTCYWRKRNANPANADPDRDRCGLIWCSPLAPLQGSEVDRMTSICISTLLEHGFEPMISLTLMTDRTVGCVTSIIYDRDVQGEDERAHRCHQELQDRLAQNGYYPYRLGIQSMRLFGHAASLGRFLGDIKRRLDPKGILAPGRYQA